MKTSSYFPGFSRDFRFFPPLFSFVVCVSLFSLEAVFAQCWDGQSLRYISPQLVLLDVLTAGALVLFSKRLAQLAAVVQCFLSLFIVSYVCNLRTLPTLTTMVNGFHLLTEVDSLFSYVCLPAVPILLLTCGLKLFFIGKMPLWPRRLRLGVAMSVTLLWGGWISYRLLRGEFVWESKPSALKNPTIRDIQHLGYAVAWTMEFLQDKPAQARRIFVQRTCSAEAVEGLPVFSLGARISLIQVESLDYSAVGATEEGRRVAPHLTAMSKEALFLEMDGTKNLASANSDYELLNGKVAENEVFYYAYLVSFPDSVIWPLQRRGYATTVFHGGIGKYMSLRRVYPLMGFSNLYFKEELKEAGLEEYPLLFMEQIPDGPLLDYAALHARAATGPFLHFIITLTMHAEAPPEFAEGFPGKTYLNSLNYFDVALGRYWEAMREGDTVILYGDHQSYNGPQRSGTVPFLIYTKGKQLSREVPAGVVYSRCEISHYLRALFEVSSMEQMKKADSSEGEGP